MKNLIFVFTILFMMCLRGCSTEEPFVFSEENVNAVLAANDMPFIIETLDDIEKSSGAEHYLCSIINMDSQQPNFGVLNYYTGEESGRYAIITHALNYDEYTDKAIGVVCNVMNIKDSQPIIDKIADCLATGENAAYSDDTVYYDDSVKIEFVYDKYVITAGLLSDGAETKLVSFGIYDEKYDQWQKQQTEKIRQELYEKYPLYYTQQPWDVPPAPTLEDINSGFAAENIPFTALDIDTTVSELGFTNYSYELKDENGVQSAYVTIRQLVSGKYANFMYIMLSSDYYQQPEAGSYPVRAAAAAFGGVDDIEGLEQKVNTFIAENSGSYAGISPDRYIQHGDIYCKTETYYDYNTEQIYLMGITLYEPDALKAELSLTIETSEMDKQIYDKFFG